MASSALPPRILYIDDDEGLRRLVRRALERRGYSVDLADSGDQGVAMAGAEMYDLVAVDHYMPIRDGLATLDALTALPAPPPVIYVTGSEESRIAVAALKAGAIDYVVKTVGDDFFDLLARTIDQALVQVSLRAQKEAAEAQLRESNARLQTLLHEVNHRVANSLQLVSAFVHMQARSAGEGAKAALADTQRRIAAIAQVHRRLYTSDAVDSVDMAEYLNSLLQELQETWSTPEAGRALTLVAEPIRLHTDKAVAVGVIVNELVSNACKYAYAADAAGEVRVALWREGEEFLLKVEDDGCGMPSNGAVKGTGLGSKLVNAMAATLKAAIAYDTVHAGVRATLRAAA
ncbi:sensor histidine kinase [Sphingomonas nostoxanthinifaciens]|uniref:sensor histidine kinase n=1 Tax=Sphingomonas nostoxanthinifaciens TaxID=2872652 RepID=UPI001CC1FBA5|nr:response regulator [Sphingomonas nostoxanthinifaciens]UAK24702.1 response regulator [Sphingomonas nostoxanthinifaciens]